MKLPKFLQPKAAGVPVTDGFTFQDVQTFLQSLGLATGDISADKLNSATYFACMDIRCKAISTLPLRVMKLDEDGGSEQDRKHYLSALLKYRPNPYMSIVDFLYAREFMKLEYGNAYVYAHMKRGQVAGLYLLDSTRMTVYVDDAGTIDKNGAVWYFYTDKNGKPYTFRHDQIVHLKNHTKDGIVGTPVKRYLAETIENEQYSSKFINNYWKNGVQGRAILQYTGSKDTQEIEKMRTTWEKVVAGIKNAGRIIPVGLGYEIKEFNPKLVDSQFFELQGLTIRHIANAFGVKMHQLNDLGRSTYNNIESQNRNWLTDTLQHELVQDESESTWKLITQDDIEAGYYLKYDLDSLLRADILTRYQAYEIGVRSGIDTPNEIRGLEGKKGLPGGEKLIVNGAVIPLEQAGAAYNLPEGGETSVKVPSS
ncbi:phage portal protein [Paenibacillus sp. MAH-36]|uniref:Phage portal protein n=1 Tax=Paenibacillus violae TaxID=3077234 RepID=A0ABU3R8G4_9BACL|nr:phage portal protein [Paenibacillus sp. PFR10]MDU0200157.1 phage portal protein [Paenibacillus sp. PFR10]